MAALLWSEHDRVHWASAAPEAPAKHSTDHSLDPVTTDANVAGVPSRGLHVGPTSRVRSDHGGVGLAGLGLVVLGGG